MPVPENVSDTALTIVYDLMDSASYKTDTHDYGKHWKFPTEIYKTSDVKLAGEISIGLDFYLGGSEGTCDGKFYSVSSLGYYHYVGA